MTRMPRKEVDMHQPVRIWLQRRVADYNFMGVIPAVNFQESCYSVHCTLSLLLKESNS